MVRGSFACPRAVGCADPPRSFRARGLVALAGLLGLVAELLTASGAAARGELLSVPEPPKLASFDRTVRIQYSRLRGALDRALADESVGDAELAEAFGRLGMWAQTYQSNEVIESAYRNARQLAPNDERWTYYLGRYYRRIGDTPRAREALARTLELSPHDVPSLVYLAEIALELGELDEAGRLFSLALEQDPQCPRALWGVGRVALQRGEPAQAIEPLERAVAMHPNAPKIHYSLGLAYRSTGQLELAEKHLAIGADRPKPGRKPPLMRDPRWSEVARMNVSATRLQQRARLLLDAGKPDAAARVYRRAVAVDSADPGPFVNLGSALLMAGRFEEAIDAYRQALARDPDLAIAHFNLGQALRQAGRANEAEPYFRRTLELDPGAVRARISLGVTLAERGEADAAVVEIDRAIELDPGDSSYRQLRAQILLASGHYARAATALEQDVRSLPEDAPLALLLARLLASAPDPALRDGARSLELARRASKVMGRFAAAETLAMAHAELGDFERAVSWQRAALDDAHRNGRDREVAGLRERLALYESGRPCRTPWGSATSGAATEPASPGTDARPAPSS